MRAPWTQLSIVWLLWKCTWITADSLSFHSLLICCYSACIPASLHTCTEYTLKEKIYIEGHSQTQFWLVLNLSCTICCFWSKLYWTNCVYLAHTLSILCNNNTTVPRSSCSQHLGFASAEWNKAKPQILFMYVDVIFVVFICFKKEECHIHFVLHCQHAALSWELQGRMRC